MVKKLVSTLVLIAALLIVSGAQQNRLTQSFIAHRYQLRVQEGKLAGNGASVIEDAIIKAQFVLIGEDHGIAEIPPFVSAVCKLTGQAGFHTMAIETGPTVAAKLQEWVNREDRLQQVATFEKEFPISIAIYNMRQENDALADCAKSVTNGKLHLWGLDQEFIGSPGLLLNRIEETHPKGEAETIVRQLIQENNDDYKKAALSHNPADLFMFSVKDDTLTRLKELLRQSGTTQSQSLLDLLMESREIYRQHQDATYDANHERSLLMKHIFLHDFDLARKGEGSAPKVLLKFGAIHMYKGFNLLRNNDIGNFITELAEGNGSQAVHIIVVPVKGSQLRFAGVGLPYKPGPFDNSSDKDSFFLPLKPIFENLEPDGWTLFDLRALRSSFDSLGPVDGQVERLIFGYDFMVVIPVATPSSQIQ